MKKASLFTLTALTLIACAAPTGNGDGGDGDGDGDGTANTGGGNVVTGTGGADSSGTGGAITSTGGTLSGTGGTLSGTGGTTGGSEITCMGTTWGVANGYVDNGTWCGYGYTASWDGATVMPANFEGATELCGSGATNGPQADPSYPGFEVGFGVRQHMSEAGNESSWMTSGTGITINFTATGATGDGAVVAKLGIPGTTDPSYGVRLTAAQAASGSVTLAWSEFNTQPWDNLGTTAAGQPISQIALQVRGTDEAAQNVSALCITSVTLNQ